MEFVGAESVGTGGALEEEASEVGNLGALRSQKCLAKRDNFHGFGAHGFNLWLVLWKRARKILKQSAGELRSMALDKAPQQDRERHGKF